MLPLRQHGPADTWEAVRRGLAACGSAVVYAELADWLPTDLTAQGLRPLLGREDRVRLEKISHPQIRKRFAASRVFLRSAACAVLELPRQAVELAYKPGGRPYLRGMDQVDISLSHTDTLLLVGLTERGRIGVDVELTSRQMLGLGTEKQICTPWELTALEQVPEARVARARPGAAGSRRSS
jgi:4'-phosphopantetheinyl transferase